MAASPHPANEPSRGDGTLAPDPRALGREVVATCLERGFTLAGICAADPVQRANEFRQWLATGQHGEMIWLADTADVRLDPRGELPGAKSIIMVADMYHGGTPDAADPGPASPPRGKIARYARGRDYHWFIKRRLHGLNDALRARYPGQEFRTFVDTAPVHERAHAERAALGWIGKHTLLIHPRQGSYLLLGGTLTSMSLIDPRTADGAVEPARIPDHCGTCTRCIDACPTGAITPWRVDARRCIAYLTIEHTGPIAPDLHAGIGDWVFGCDICQEVCPHNQPRRAGEARRANPEYAPPASRREGFDLIEMLHWTETRKRAALEGSAAKRADLAMLKRNAAIALANVALAKPEHRPAALEALRAAVQDSTAPPSVRDAAAQSIERVTGADRNGQSADSASARHPA